MFLSGHSPCLWASRTRICPKPVVEFVRWRGKSARTRKLEKAKKKGVLPPTPAYHQQRHDENTNLRSHYKTNGPNEKTADNFAKPVDEAVRVDSRPPKIDKQRQLIARLIEKRCGLEVGRFKRQYSRDTSVWGVANTAELTELASSFIADVAKQCLLAVQNPIVMPELFRKFRQAFIEGDVNGLDEAIKHAFSNFIVSRHLTDYQSAMQKDTTHMTHPSEWFPATRALQRKVILHVGPTNSGKTYHALKRLEEAKTGVFAGPLRLLAHEVFTRFNAKNKPCALITGEEKRLPPGFDSESDKLNMRSCTVEMVPLNLKVDVCVIDEIQMIGDQDRGWAWTQAFLGVQAREIHLCGEARTVPLIKELCALIGDEVEVNEYHRLSPLKTEHRSLNGDLSKLQKGDCVIVFSRIGIHNMKRQIEKATGKRCAVVYGSLPPETRAQQAALFNDQDNDYDFLVASDAIGMGLNLSIKRVIFESLKKFDGVEFDNLKVAHLKQIAGRAGRYRTADQAVKTAENAILGPDYTSPQPKPEAKSVGLVTTLSPQEFSFLRSSMLQEPGPIQSAGLYASDDIIQQFSALFPPSTPFSYLLLRLHEIAKLHPRFHLCRLRDQILVSDLTQAIKLTIPERLTLIAAPAMLRMRGIPEVLKDLATCISQQSGGDILEIPSIKLELLDEPEELQSKVYLEKLEALHSSINLYIWLSYRFIGVFKSTNVAFHVKGLVEEKIDRVLSSGEVKMNKRAARKALKSKTTNLSAMDDDALEEALGSMGDVEDNNEGERQFNI